MTGLGSEIDASFYNLVHQLAVAKRRETAAERRRRRRQGFQSIQRIALPRKPGIPAETDFVEVRCHDLTRQGFSFLLPSRPTFDLIVAAFGAPPDVIYVLAKVTHCAEVLVSASGSVQPATERGGGPNPRAAADATARPMVLVGCRFIERLRK